MSIFLTLIPFILALLFSLAIVPVLVWMERRIAALIQDRLGPNRCNIGGIRLGGLIQSIADVVKLFFKEEIHPHFIKNRFYYLVAPSLSFIAAFLSFMVIPFGDNYTYNGVDFSLQALDIDLGILWFLGFASLGVYGIILAGWASSSKFGILGSLRAASQVISYEVAMSLAILSFVISYESIDFRFMVQAQSETFLWILPSWGVFMQPLATLILIVTAFAETNRAPFDAAEGESEIVAGYHTEYGAMKFGLFFVAEYVAMAASSALMVTLIFGGYNLPYIDSKFMGEHLSYMALFFVTVSSFFTYVLIRWIKKNNNYSNKSKKESKIYYILLLGFLAFIFVLFGYLVVFNLTSLAIAIMQVMTFLIKFIIILFFFIWVRWTFPRFRYDQTQKLGWNLLLPLSIANVLVTAIVVVGVN